MVTPLSANWMVPVSPEAEEARVPVKVTLCPMTDGLAELATVSDVATSDTSRSAGVLEVLAVKVWSPL